MSDVQSALRARISGEVDFTAGAPALYAADASNYRQPPVGVVLPRTIEDVIATVRTCREYDAAILPRGAGTSLAGQCCNAAIVIDMSRHLRGILSIDPERRTARVQPGVVLDHLQHALEPHGLMFGPDPATHAWCTFGGMIGNDSCGVHSLIGGTTADAVVQLDVLTSDGVRPTLGAMTTEEFDLRSEEKGRAGEIYRRLGSLATHTQTRFARGIREFPAGSRATTSTGYCLNAALIWPARWSDPKARASPSSKRRSGS